MSDSVRPHRRQPPGSPSLGFSRQEHWSGVPLPSPTGGASGKEPMCLGRSHKRCGFDPWVRKISWRREWQPTPVLLSEESHGQRSCKESDMTEMTQHSRTTFSSSQTRCFLFHIFSLEPNCKPVLRIGGYILYFLCLCISFLSGL